MALFGNSIAARVSRRIKKRVADAEKEHVAECVRLDKECEQRKEAHAEAMVDRITGAIR